MRVIHLAEDPGTTFNIPAMSLLVTNYKTGCYEGNGDAYGLSDDGQTVYEFNLSHCSCFGPWEGSRSGSLTAKYQIAAFRDAVLGDRVTVGGIADLDTAKRFLKEVDHG